MPITDAESESLRLNVSLLAGRVRTLEKMLDTRDTVWWRRLLFRLDGWPPWYRLADRPAWRPWHRWWTS
jgi:hypothetical protein